MAISKTVLKASIIILNYLKNISLNVFDFNLLNPKFKRTNKINFDSLISQIHSISTANIKKIFKIIFKID